LKFSGFYGAGQHMGYSPRQVDEMTLWEFNACYDAWKIANGIKSRRGGDISEERLAKLGIAGF
jgi:hypothetical protein